uniref:Virion structural protein n=1 Tax=Stenotrophomonas phage vB_SmaS_QH3 TaxID=3229738 RepID=A0AAU7YUY3_9CAUD
MANIAYVTSNTSHASVTTTKAMLESKGHTVTLFTSAAATTVGLAPYDIVLTSRTTENATHSAVIKAVSDSGKPVLCGFGTLTAGSDQATTPAVVCKIAPSERGISSGNRQTFYADVASPVYDGTGITIPSTVNFATATTFTASIPKAGASPGDIVGSLASTATDRGIIFFAAGGSATYDGGVFGGNIGYCGFLYGGAAYSTQAATIIDNMIQLLMSQGFVLSGTVKDASANPLARRVRAHRRSDGRMVASAMSNGTTGAFTLHVWSTDPHYMVCLDADGGTKNALIKDRVIPVEV